jgi:hypothetical protein
MDYRVDVSIGTTVAEQNPKSMVRLRKIDITFGEQFFE